MAAPPRLGATLLLLLLLRAPPPGWGNEGGALGLCKCQRLMRAPGGRLQDLADKVKGYQACGGHLVRFELPRIQICGLASADWVTELRGLWEKKDPVWGPGLAPRKGEGAGNGPLPTQPRHYLTAVPVLVGIILVLVGVLTYMLCRRHQRAPPGPGSPHRDSGTGTLYYPCELG
ncbi:uncharacterized protein LOC115643109 isoform X2 [Gopherus evgoodei]|uniref:uncharacterized protein LOC115643109 isoform X2 n=1 Tax=Gopherus evgoodei TaxID=1825980 RepID=UPI0011D02FAB|nr:uncharacterized protein LOC115643109 isoform X2 [Gopherus evgoodei]